MYVTGRLALLFGAGVVPLVLLVAAGADPWLVCAGWAAAIAVAAAADVAAAGDPREVEVIRRLPAQARRDQVVEVALRLRNRGRRRVRGLLRDGWQPTAGAEPGRVDLDVPAGQEEELRMRLRPRRRGEIRTGFVALRSRGPLGLAGRQATIAAPGAVRVLPAFSSRRALPARLARVRELDGSASVQVRGRGTEFDGLREYVRGDDVRSIDWRATARAGTTMLRTWRPERDRHVAVLIDTGRTSAARAGEGTRLDAAMEAALLLGAIAAAAGDHVHLVMADRVVRARVTGPRGRALVPAMMAAMADVEPHLVDTDWDAAAAWLRALTARPALLVVLTAQDEPEASRAFLSTLMTLSARAPVLVGSVADVPAAARPHRLRPQDAYLAAAHERVDQDARRLQRAIGRAGAAAVIGDPAALPPRIADHYLDLKSLGRL